MTTTTATEAFTTLQTQVINTIKNSGFFNSQEQSDLLEQVGTIDSLHELLNVSELVNSKIAI